MVINTGIALSYTTIYKTLLLPITYEISKLANSIPNVEAGALSDVETLVGGLMLFLLP